jgi:predicted metal-dependent hydrolase
MTGPLNVKRHPKADPVPDPANDPRLEEGIHLFNSGQHWHAHEAWEPLWMGLEGEDKLYLQGFIMAAAMLVQHGKRVPRGVANHWENVKRRLHGRSGDDWGLDHAALLQELARFAQDAESGAWRLDGRDVRIRRA